MEPGRRWGPLNVHAFGEVGSSEDGGNKAQWISASPGA